MVCYFLNVRSTAVLQALKNKSGVVSVPLKGNSLSPRFSEIVGTMTEANAKKFGIGAVHKKIQQKKFSSQRGDPLRNGDFKVGLLKTFFLCTKIFFLFLTIRCAGCRGRRR